MITDPSLKDTKPLLYATLEALKEMGRYMVSLGVVDSLVLLFQLIMSMINTTTGDIFIDWRIVGAFSLFSVCTAIVRGLDKLKFAYSKAVDEIPGKSQGLVGF